MKKYRIALIPGDGIGPEIIAEGVKVIERVADLNGFDIEWREYDNGAEKYLKTGELITEETLKEIEQKCNAIYLGALGDPRVKPGILEKGILLKMRFYFDQFINLRPVRLLGGVKTPLRDKGPTDINFDVVRENTEDFYVGIGNRAKIGKSKQELEIVRSLYKIKFGLDIDTQGSEIAYQIGVISREGAKRVIKYAFELTKRKKRDKLTSVDKANVLDYVYSFWREILEEVARDYPGINYEFNFVDNLDKASALRTDQIDIENGERYNIRFVDRNGKSRHPLILHCSPSGAIERVMYALLEKAEFDKKDGMVPMLPLWLSPTQVRVIPVSDEFLDYAMEITDNLRKNNIRADIDDRTLHVGKKIREAEVEWCSTIVVIGEKEIKSKKLPVRVRGKKELVEMTTTELIDYIKKKTWGMPFQQLPLPKRLSKRPVFVG